MEAARSRTVGWRRFFLARGPGAAEPRGGGSMAIAPSGELSADTAGIGGGSDTRDDGGSDENACTRSPSPGSGRRDDGGSDDGGSDDGGSDDGGRLCESGASPSSAESPTDALEG